MADVTRQENLVRGLPGQVALAVGEVPGCERGVHAHLVLALGQRLEGALAEAEAPALRVVRGPVRDPVRPVGQRVEMRHELGAGEARGHRWAVVDDVEVRAPEIDDARARGVLDPRVANVPLRGDRPVEDLRPAGNLVDLEAGQLLAETPERLPEAIAGDAPAERVEVRHPGVHSPPQIGAVEGPPEFAERHDPTFRHAPLKSSYVRSRSAMIRSSSGQRMSKAGSSQRTPRACSGAWNSDIW